MCNGKSYDSVFVVAREPRISNRIHSFVSKIVAFALFCFIGLWGTGGVHAQAFAEAADTGKSANDYWQRLVDKPLPLVVATTAAGPLKANYPFDPEKFGTTRGYCPSCRIRSNSIVIYTLELDEPVLLLLEALNKHLVNTNSAEESYLHVFDVKGAQLGGYTKTELVDRINQIENLVQSRRISHISVGIAANREVGSRMGLGVDRDTLVVLVRAPSEKGDVQSRGTVAEFEFCNSDILVDEAQRQKLVQRLCDNFKKL